MTSYEYGLQLVKLHQNVNVTPYTELLASTRGLSDHKGGPIWENWESEIDARHCRSGKIPVDIKPDEPNDITEVLNEDYIWIGPLCHHFGHQLADFSMRIPQVLGSNFKKFLVGSTANQPRIVSEYSRFHLDILSYFDIEESQVKVINSPTLVRRLWVAPQAETIFGPPPSLGLLNKLEEHYSSKFRRKSNDNLFGSVVYVSRSKYKRGVIAGEVAIDSFFKKIGALVIYPEEHTLDELLPLYACSDHVVMSEGSAMHALQFLGRQINQLTIISRGQSKEYGSNFLRPRCRDLMYVQCNSFGLSGRANGRFRETGLGFLDGEALSEKLCVRLGVDHCNFDVALFQHEQRTSINSWLIDYVLPNQYHLNLSSDILKLELEKLNLIFPAVKYSDFDQLLPLKT